MHPYLFDLPLPDALCSAFGDAPCSLHFYSYGAMLGLGFYAGWYLARHLVRRDGLAQEHFWKGYVLAVIASLIGARVLFFVANPDRLDSLGRILMVSDGGMVAYGGFIGGALGSWWFCRAHGISLLAWADCIVPSVGLGTFTTRVGCFLYGCDFGSVAGVPWSVSFPQGSPAWKHQVAQGLIDASAVRSLSVHPTQLYEALLGLALVALTLLVRRFRRYPGEAFFLFFAAYGLVRSYLEVLRDDPQRGYLGAFTTSQFIGLLSLFLALTAYVRLRAGRYPFSGRKAPAEALT